jgi:site-specific DNA-methyltransferase (cytosine-N4-specific)
MQHNGTFSSPVEEPTIAFETSLGFAINSTVEDYLGSERYQKDLGTVDLIVTSPPFPLLRAKAYGNKTGQEYLRWMESLAKPLGDLLSPSGSLVIEIGNSWEPGIPAMSTLPMKTLLAFQESGEFFLAQEFICHNPARLPGPAIWVTRERVRVKDSFTRVWWLSRSPHPKADNRKILNQYSPAMQKLLKSGKYNTGVRPSEHNIKEGSFLKDNGGSIGANVLSIPNTNGPGVAYLTYCKENGLTPHPARMQPQLVDYFIEFLTDEGDRVFDPFGGSMTTGAVAEGLERRWFATEPNSEYLDGSKGRFLGRLRG